MICTQSNVLAQLVSMPRLFRMPAGVGGRPPISPNPPTQPLHGAPLWASHSLGHLPPSPPGLHIASQTLLLFLDKFS